MVTDWLPAKPGTGLGLIDVIRGVEVPLPVTVKLKTFDCPVSGLMTWAVQLAAPVPTLIWIVSWFAEMNVTCVPVRSAWPPGSVACTFSPVPLWKPLPLMVTDWLPAKPGTGLGLIDVIRGVEVPLPVTVKLKTFDCPVSGLMTWAVQLAAPLPTLIWIVSWFAEM